jgi:hypothetical protein
MGIGEEETAAAGYNGSNLDGMSLPAGSVSAFYASRPMTTNTMYTNGTTGKLKSSSNFHSIRKNIDKLEVLYSSNWSLKDQNFDAISTT